MFKTNKLASCNISNPKKILKKKNKLQSTQLEMQVGTILIFLLAINKPQLAKSTGIVQLFTPFIGKCIYQGKKENKKNVIFL